jgi:Flp pilus assembly protein TadD
MSEIQMMSMFSTGKERSRRGFHVGSALVLAIALAGCRGCTDPESAEQEVLVKSKDDKKRDDRVGKRKSDRQGLRKIRSLTMRVERAAEADRPLSEAVEVARGLIEQGEEALTREAIADLQAWIAEHPDDVDAHYWCGRAHMSVFEKTASIEHFSKAIEGDDTYVLPHRWQALALMQQRNFEKAAPHIARAVELTPEAADVYIDRLFWALRAKQLDTVVSDLEKVCLLGETDLCDTIPAARALVERRSTAETRRGAKGSSADPKKRKSGMKGKKGKKGKGARFGGRTLGGGGAKLGGRGKAAVEDDAGTEDETTTENTTAQ